MRGAMSNYIVKVKVYFQRGPRVVDMLQRAKSEGSAMRAVADKTKDLGGNVVSCHRVGAADVRYNYTAQLKDARHRTKYVLVSELPSLRDAEKAVMRKITGVPEYRGYRIVELKETTV